MRRLVCVCVREGGEEGTLLSPHETGGVTAPGPSSGPATWKLRTLQVRPRVALSLIFSKSKASRTSQVRENEGENEDR